MSQVNHLEQENWEYRHRRFEPKRTGPGFQEQDHEFIEWLIETLEGMDHAEEGWRMVSAKIESDDRGRSWLDVLLKRPLADSRGSSIPHAA
jgi:hypothetical protein